VRGVYSIPHATLVYYGTLPDKKIPSQDVRSLKKDGVIFDPNYQRLPYTINVHASADRFLEKVEGWLKDPSSFETADLKPELVRPATTKQPAT
jgi:hypothetical protein